MTPAELSRTVLRAVRRAVDEDVLRAPVPEHAVVERPRPGGRGDYATNVALKLAGPAGRPAREVAEILRGVLLEMEEEEGTICDVEVTGPGFLNLTLAHDAHASLVRTVLSQGHAYGHGHALAGDVVRVGSGPHADAVARLVHAQGGTVVRTSATDAPVADLGALRARLGRDGATWRLIWPTATAAPDDLLVQRETNPLFRVRYAHARCRALVRNAAALGFIGDGDRGEGEGAGVGGGGGVSEEYGVARVLADYPGVLDAAARHRAPDRLARHLDMAAEAFFRFHDTHPVLPLGDEKPSVAHRSRLALAEATATVLAGGLSLLGVSAPEHL
ncbi:ArgS-related anticodon-binding protein NrtL [Streptomyces sp. ISL-100]|uniref:ArgS-related anticodon-binding protein NrtL n=1 Tax=Streptomyces sp. ISL-100 TaxID=2819173 RepID=UPI001BECCCE4|nr:DALR anticodon-binding domain-containing protein [Streptomyces sp. ISL-100]MBT2396459.1 arginine--tRNA ligase [Streptomyces sp. ISL-100]